MATTVTSPRCVRFVLSALISIGALLVATDAIACCQFVASVRVTPNTLVEFEWPAAMAWFGKVEIFNNADGTGIPVTAGQALDDGGSAVVAFDQVVTFPIAGPILANSTFFFRVTATDPTNLNADVVSPRPCRHLHRSAGALQRRRGVDHDDQSDHRVVNVISFGKFTYGPLNQTVQHAFNISDHAFDFTGLSPAKTYQFMAGNIHAIDGDPLASQSDQFTTSSPPISVVLTKPNGEPRVIGINQPSVSVRMQSQDGAAVSGVTVGFATDASSAGGGVLSAAHATTYANGTASVQFTASRRGLVQITVLPPAAGINSLTIPAVVADLHRREWTAAQT
jgi:hypothetical protein